MITKLLENNSVFEKWLYYYAEDQASGRVTGEARHFQEEPVYLARPWYYHCIFPPAKFFKRFCVPRNHSRASRTCMWLLLRQNGVCCLFFGVLIIKLWHHWPKTGYEVLKVFKITLVVIKQYFDPQDHRQNNLFKTTTRLLKTALLKHAYSNLDVWQNTLVVARVSSITVY